MVIKVDYSVSPIYINTNVSPIYIKVDYGTGGGAAAVWGQITGTLSDQTDLQNALDDKVPYTGATGDVDLGEYELKAGQVELDQTPTGTAGVAVTRWNDSVGTIETTLKGGNVILRHGRDMFERIVNKTGIQLTKAAYQAVRISTAQGQRLGVALAQANNDNNSADTIGLVVETIDNNQEGIIYTFGEIDGLNTTGSLQGETWADGDVLYLSPTVAGRITNIKPVAPQHLVVIGYVVYAHANNGKIYVKTMNGYELGELHDVDTTGATNGQVLKYNGTIWTPSSDLDTGITSLNGLTALTQTFATGTSGTDFNISSATSTHTFNLPTASATNRGLLSTSDWSTFNAKQDALTLTTTGTSGAATLIGSTLNIPQYSGTNIYNSDGTLTGNRTVTSGGYNLTFTGSNTATSAIARGLNLTHTLIAAANNDVLVGLDINPTFTNGAFTGVRNLGFRIGGATGISYDATSKRLAIGAYPALSLAVVDIQRNANEFTYLRIQNTNGGSQAEVGLRLQSDSGLLDITNFPTAGGNSAVTYFQNTSANGIRFWNNTSSATANIDFATGTGSGTVRARIFSNGNTIIGGTTDAGYKLDVNGSTRSVTFRSDNSSQAISGSTAYQPNYFFGLATYANAVNTTAVVSGTWSQINHQFNTSTISNATALTTYNVVTMLASGGTITVTQPTYLNAVSSINAQNYITGSVNMTLSHMAGIVVKPILANAAGTLTVTNYYGLLINDTTQSAAAFSPANRWGIYQEGSSDKNYFNGRILVGTTTDAGYKLDVQGTGRFTGRITSTVTNDSGIVLQQSGYLTFDAGGNNIMSSSAALLIGGGTTGLGIRFGTGIVMGTGSAAFHYITSNYALFSTQSSAVDLSTGIPASAVLEARSTTKGFLPPRMTTTQKNAIATPAAGLIVFDTTLAKLCVYSGTAWETITSI